MSRKSKHFKIPAVETGITVTVLAALANKYIKNSHNASNSANSDKIAVRTVKSRTDKR